MSKQIKIFDTTLRDGEQSPGCSMNLDEKIEVATQLEKLGVDIIEAGFAIASEGDFNAIVEITKKVKKATICSLARATEKDIKRAGESLKLAQKGRIHTFIATSPIHMKYKLNMTPDQVIENAIKAVKLAKTYVTDVEFSCEDAGRSEPDFLVKIITEAIKAGATTINIPDTVGYKTPTEYGELIKYVVDNTPNIETVDVSVHCHDDLGFAAANSLAGVLNGATQIECTINGIGERAGNTALEEVVMALKVREDFYKCHTNINTKELFKTSKLVSNVTGSVVQPNKAIVGANAFAHEAGIHQDGMLKKRQTYEIMEPEMVGISKTSLVLGKHSGRHAFKDKLNELGIELSEDEINKAFVRFKRLADQKKTVENEDIEAIVADETHHTYEIFHLETVEVHSTYNENPTAKVVLTKDGKSYEAQESGAGSVDAIYNTIDAIVGKDFQLKDYIVQAVTGGTDALGEVVVRLIDEKDRIFTGRGAALDVLIASAKAYVMAVNKLLTAKGKKRIKPTL
jgi:2-isopropylmalate synthase